MFDSENIFSRPESGVSGREVINNNGCSQLGKIVCNRIVECDLPLLNQLQACKLDDQDWSISESQYCRNGMHSSDQLSLTADPEDAVGINFSSRGVTRNSGTAAIEVDLFVDIRYAQGEPRNSLRLEGFFLPK